MADLAGERRCVAIDLPLHGHTPATPDQDFTLAGLARFAEDFCDELGLTRIDPVANDTGAVAQIVAAHQQGRLATLTLTNCETHDNVPPRAFKPTIMLARTGLLALLGPWLLSDTGRARAKVFGNGYESPNLPDDAIVRAYLEPVLGTRQAARQFQRMLASLRAADLLAVEPELGRQPRQAPALDDRLTRVPIPSGSAESRRHPASPAHPGVPGHHSPARETGHSPQPEPQPDTHRRHITG